MKLDGIQAITFDAAGTLIAPHPSVGEVYAEVLASLGYPVSPDTLEYRFRHAFQALKRDHPDAVLDRAGWRIIVSAALRDLTPEDDFDRQFDALWDAFAQPERWRLLPGVDSTLAKLNQRGMRLFVLSNNDSRLHGILEGLGVGAFFEAVFVSAELGAEKPSRKIFQLAQARIGAPAGAILHVGDSPVEDVKGALEAGWRAALVGPKAGTTAAIPIITRAPGIAELFADKMR